MHLSRPAPDVPPPALSAAASAALDALRALAANLVLVSHVLLLHLGVISMQGAAGAAVSMFFVLSGLLVTLSILQWRRRPAPRLPGFLADRVARIATPYVPALLLIAMADLLLVTTTWGAPGLNAGVLAFAGNLLMLQDHSLFNVLQSMGFPVPWRVRPYNTAEPFWTVSIELWIYVAVGLFVFCLLSRERVRRRWLWPMLLLSVPVVVWNAAAGGGKSLTLIWLLGAVAACALVGLTAAGGRLRGWLALWLVALGAAALTGRVAKVGFDAFDLQTAALAGVVLFGALIGLDRVRTVPPLLARGCGFFASYSYSLYLIHNTVLVVMWEALRGVPLWLSIASGVLMSHGVAYTLYLVFERHHRRVGAWLRPRFEHALRPRLTPAPASIPTPLPSAERS